MALNNFAQVVQSTPNSSGAYALAAALEHLDQSWMGHRLNVANLAEGYNQLSPLNFAQRIYETAGHLHIDIENRLATYQYQSPVSDKCPPSSLVYMAAQLGNAADISFCYNKTAEETFRAIHVINPGASQNLLETETALIKAPIYGNIYGPADMQLLPENNTVYLLLVNQYSHWITITSRELYDPATGFTGPYTVNDQFPLTSICYTHNNKVHSYDFSGIWITLKG